jgi:FkbM family methyltransferase
MHEAILDGAERRARLLAWQRITTVVDVGANAGQYAQRMRAAGFGGRIVSFEPLRRPFSELERACACDPHWACHRLALGPAPGAMPLNIAGDDRNSSALAVLDRHVRAAPASSFVGVETVPVRDLDAALAGLVDPSERLWVKVDVQGGELGVLIGASGTLRRTAVLELEVSLVPLYESGPLLDEVYAFVRGRGFRATGFESVLDDVRTGETLQVDALFVGDGISAAAG